MSPSIAAGSTALIMSCSVSPAIATAVSASISTPVFAVTATGRGDRRWMPRLELELDRHRVERQQVRERDQLARALRPRDAGDARGREHVGLRQPVGPHERDDLGGRVEPAAGDRDAARDGLRADVDHARAAVVVEVAQLGHSSQVSTESPAARSTTVSGIVDEHVGCRERGDQVRPRSRDGRHPIRRRDAARAGTAAAPESTAPPHPASASRGAAPAARRARAAAARRTARSSAGCSPGCPGSRRPGCRGTSRSPAGRPAASRARRRARRGARAARAPPRGRPCEMPPLVRISSAPSAIAASSIAAERRRLVDDPALHGDDPRRRPGRRRPARRRSRRGSARGRASPPGATSSLPVLIDGDPHAGAHGDLGEAGGGQRGEVPGGEPHARGQQHRAGRRSEPASRTYSPAARGARDRDACRRRRSVSSTGTTASAPSGTGAPVMMRTAVPGRASRDRRAPPRSRRRSAAPPAQRPSPSTSAARTAKPSICELRNGGRAIGDVTSAAVTRPSASASGTGSAGRSRSGASSAATRAACSRDRRPCLSGAAISTWARRVDLDRPGVDAAGEVPRAREPVLLEQLEGARRADAVVAVHDDRGVRGRVRRAGPAVRRAGSAPSRAGRRTTPRRLAHIQQHRAGSRGCRPSRARQQLRELLGGDRARGVRLAQRGALLERSGAGRARGRGGTRSRGSCR